MRTLTGRRDDTAAPAPAQASTCARSGMMQAPRASRTAAAHAHLTRLPQGALLTCAVMLLSTRPVRTVDFLRRTRVGLTSYSRRRLALSHPGEEAPAACTLLAAHPWYANAMRERQEVSMFGSQVPEVWPGGGVCGATTPRASSSTSTSSAVAIVAAASMARERRRALGGITTVRPSQLPIAGCRRARTLARRPGHTEC